MVQFFELNVPDHLSIYVGSQPHTFAEVSRQQLELIDKYIGEIPVSSNVLEIGCGPGKLSLPFAKRLTAGQYTGFDISKECIDWCNTNIARRYRNTTFKFADVRSSMYNPSGSVSDAKFRLPVESDSTDLIILCSVFTHMMEDGVTNYLHECRRILRPGGSVFATWFILSDVVLRHCRLAPGPIGNFTFHHQMSKNCQVNDKDNPLGTVGFTLPWIIKATSEADLQMDYLVNAYWSGTHPGADMGQDLTILSRRSR